MKIFFILLTSSALLLSACLPTRPEQPTPPPQATELEADLGSTDENILSVVLQAEFDGQTALELLRDNANIETTEFAGAGEFITAINGVESNNQNFWSFYVNGEFAQAGASETVLEEGDEVEFVYEAIDTEL